MILHVPNLQSLKLALLSDAIPSAVSVAPVKVARVGEELWLESSKSLTSAQVAALQKLGMVQVPASPTKSEASYHCWPQILPLEREPLESELSGKKSILFELPSPARFAELVHELLRLGNDRQSFRWLQQGNRTAALLRVIDPPYYTLLRASDTATDGEALHAYREVSPRVWTALGFQHPLANKLRLGPGKLLFLRPVCHWHMIDEGTFQDIYQTLEFQVPQMPSRWEPSNVTQKIAVPLRLFPSASAEPAELWVLRHHAREQLDEFVTTVEEDILDRLTFAVGKRAGEELIVLRARPSPQGPPILVLDAVAYRSYLRIPNLFVPTGSRLQPLLRRDALVALLASDSALLNWLYPQENGNFTPECLPDGAFRPLRDWVDYVIDVEAEPLDAWMQSHRFEFESYICKEEALSPTEPLPPGEPDVMSPRLEEKSPESKPTTPVSPSRQGTKIAAPVMQAPAELEKKLRTLEEQYRSMTAPWDDAARQPLWQQMAHCNAVLGHAADATVCWTHALWERNWHLGDWPRSWLACESRGVAGGKFGLEHISPLVERSTSAPAELRCLAAFLVCAATESVSSELSTHVASVQQFLEKHDDMLPIRAAWLAWSAQASLNPGDVLTLTRARDRLLERLHVRGQNPDIDMPAFLRHTGAAATDRMRRLKSHLHTLESSIMDWLARKLPTWREKRRPEEQARYTEAYAQFILAYGYSCLGAQEDVTRLLKLAKQAVQRTDNINSWLSQAFEHRIARAMREHANPGALPAELIKKLANHVPAKGDPKRMDQLKQERYKIDKMCDASEILSPQEGVNAYDRHTAEYTDELQRELLSLERCEDLHHLKEKLTTVLEQRVSREKNTTSQLQALERCLDYAPRLGSAFASDVTSRVEQVWQRGIEVKQRAQLWRKSLYVAAHFDFHETARRLIGRIDQELSDNAGQGAYEFLEGILGRSLQGLRKLGMREEILLLLAQISQRLEVQHEEIVGLLDARQPANKVRSKPLQVLLHVASGWFHFGKDERARPALERSRDVLLRGNLIPVDQTALACAYVRAWKQATGDEAITHMVALFRDIDRVEDNTETRSHFLISMLKLVESSVLSLLGDSLAMDKEARRWLDEDELLLRRRIHLDVREALHGAGL